MTNHDYAACQDQICVRCEAYGDGYTAGKEKAHLEVRNTFTDNHAPDCGCEPCITRRTLARGIAYDAALKTAFTIVDQPYRTEDWLDLCNEIAALERSTYKCADDDMTEVKVRMKKPNSIPSDKAQAVLRQLARQR